MVSNYYFFTSEDEHGISFDSDTPYYYIVQDLGDHTQSVTIPLCADELYEACVEWRGEEDLINTLINMVEHVAHEAKFLEWGSELQISYENRLGILAAGILDTDHEELAQEITAAHMTTNELVAWLRNQMIDKLLKLPLSA